MTRLDQLSQPRAARKVGANEQNKEQGLGHANADMSKSMTHLAAGEKSLKRSAASKSMVHLGPPRMTRAERLRKLAREGNHTTSVAPTSAKQQATSPSGKTE